MSTRPPGLLIPLAWRNLTESKRRLAASLAGVAFAVTLMFMENGFRNALLDSMVNVIERFDCHLVVASRTLYTLSIPFHFPLARVEQARAVPGRLSGGPLYVETRRSVWRNPDTGLTHRVCVLAYPPDDDLLDITTARRMRDRLKVDGAVLADTRGRAEYFEPQAPGVVSELSGRRVEIVDTFSLGTNLQTDGNLVAGDQTLLNTFPDRLGDGSPESRLVTLGLLRLEPGADPDRLRAEVEAALPPDVRVFTKDGFVARERDFWNKVAPIGTVFLIGVVMGFIVGMVICYQVLFADISDRLGEFATLKAMGYSDLRLARVVVAQAVYLAVLGYAFGLAVSLPLFGWVQGATGLPMRLKAGDSLTILCLTVVMCAVSGGFAARQVFTTDPATLFD